METTDCEALVREAAHLMERLIALPAPSREETARADFLEMYMARHGAKPVRTGNNLWCEADAPDSPRPTLLLNAHIDTVRPVDGWTRPPHRATMEGGRIYGLGSNDCGGGLVTLLLLFLRLRRRRDLPWHLVFLASAEEEISGRGGVEAALPQLPHIDAALVGEPTGMRPALAEKGLMVLDCTATGRAGHAARDEGDNAIYHAMESMEWFRMHRFGRVSPLLGPVRMSVTMVEAGTQHNVVPDRCHFVVDVRSNECYTNEELLALIRREAGCRVEARSTRLNPSGIAPSHPLARAACRWGGEPFGSPTLSDQALMPFPSLKMGPGLSERSHTADEYICLHELEQAFRIYTQLLTSPPPGSDGE